MHLSQVGHSSCAQRCPWLQLTSDKSSPLLGWGLHLERGSTKAGLVRTEDP